MESMHPRLKGGTKSSKIAVPDLVPSETCDRCGRGEEWTEQVFAQVVDGPNEDGLELAQVASLIPFETVERSHPLNCRRIWRDGVLVVETVCFPCLKDDDDWAMNRGWLMNPNFG